jgi:hypothetical protein
MKMQNLPALLKLAILASAAQIAMPANAQSGGSGAMQLATGQFVSPTLIRGAVRQFLNPRLPAYANFVAGLVSVPVPTTLDLQALTAAVAQNNSTAPNRQGTRHRLSTFCASTSSMSSTSSRKIAPSTRFWAT